MTDVNYTALVLIGDRSGSMISIASEVEGGITHLLKEQAELDGRCTVDVVLFDDRYDYVAKFADPSTTTVKLEPRGMTSLYDAVGRTIIEFGHELSQLPEEERPSKVIVVIATDGDDNRSKEFDAAKIKEMIEHQTWHYSWEFIFMGANQDAVLTASALGIRAGSAITYEASAAGAAGSFASLSNYTSRFRSGGEAQFSDDERNAARGINTDSGKAAEENSVTAKLVDVVKEAKDAVAPAVKKVRRAAGESDSKKTPVKRTRTAKPKATE